MRRWGILLLIPLLVCGMALTGYQKARPVWHATRIRTDMWARLNNERTARGLKPLQWNGRLSERAERWSHEMARVGIIFHSNLGDMNVSYDYAGENVASGGTGTTGGQLSTAFMNSPEHRDNILSPGFTSAGIGVYCGPHHGLWVTVVFARRWSEGYPSPYLGGTSPGIARSDAGSVRC